MDSKKILSTIFHPILKEYGFRKSGSSWNLFNDEVIGVLNIQKSQWSDLCYINISLFIRKGEPLDFEPKYTVSHIMLRFEEIIDDTNEKLELTNILKFEKDLSEEEIKKVTNLARNTLVPFFLNNSTKNDIRRLVTGRGYSLCYDGKERLLD